MSGMTHTLYKMISTNVHRRAAAAPPRVDGGGEAQARRGAARRRRGLYVGAAGVAPGGDHLDPRPAAHDDGEPGGAPPRLAQRGAPHADRGARRLLGVNSTHGDGVRGSGGGRHHSSKFVIIHIMRISCECRAMTRTACAYACAACCTCTLANISARSMPTPPFPSAAQKSRFDDA